MSDIEIPLFSYQIDSMPRTIANRTRRVYDRLSSVYPASTFFFHARAHKLALASSGIEDGMRVLEVATGSGEMFRRLVKANPSGHTVGMDLSPKMAARTQRSVRRTYPGSHTRCHAVDARFMPYPDRCFDAVVCCYMLELLGGEDIARAISEFHRVMRRNATLTLILIGQNTRLFNRLYKVAGWVAPAFWGRQIERSVPDLIESQDFRITSDAMVYQTGYPSRVLVARK